MTAVELIVVVGPIVLALVALAVGCYAVGLAHGRPTRRQDDK